jgi:hypothetical protein
LAILATYYEVQGDLPSSDRLGRVEIPSKVPLALDEIRRIMSTRLDRLDETLVRVASTDLANLGLLIDWRMLRPDAAAIIHQRFSLTDGGVLLLRFLSGDWRQAADTSAKV